MAGSSSAWWFATSTLLRDSVFLQKVLAGFPAHLQHALKVVLRVSLATAAAGRLGAS
jgi:hypothetical protein